jgi:hypothetical protein
MSDSHCPIGRASGDLNHFCHCSQRFSVCVRTSFRDEYALRFGGLGPAGDPFGSWGLVTELASG